MEELMQAEASTMNRSEFLERLGKIAGAREKPLIGTEVLAELDTWDSLALVEFIAMVHEYFGERFELRQIMACRTVDDLVGLLGDRIGS
jgi:acyl carrier protein